MEKSRKLRNVGWITMVVVLGGALAAASVAGAADPVLVAGHPSCAQFGYTQAFRLQPEPPPSGDYIFPDGVSVLTLITDGMYMDFTSSLPVTAVIVKGGPAANVYFYAPETYGEINLVAPINPGGDQAAIGYVEVCYGLFSDPIFIDYFELGSCSAWSAEVPAP